MRGATPATAQPTSRASGRSPSCSACSAVVTMQAAAPSFWPLALPAVTVASGSTRRTHRPQPASALERRVGARVLVAVDDHVPRPAARHRRPARSRRRTGRPLLRGDGPLVRAAARARPAPARRCRTPRRRFSAVSSMPPGTGKFWPPAVTRPRARRSCSVHAVAPCTPAQPVA